MDTLPNSFFSLLPYLVSPIIAAITSFIVFKMQTSRQKTEIRRDEARKIYSAFLDDFIDGHIDGVLDDKEKNYRKNKKKYLQLRTKLFLYGDKNVLKAWIAFLDSVDNSSNEDNHDWYEDECKYVTKTLLSMKKDVSGDTILTEKEVDKYFNPMKRL